MGPQKGSPTKRNMPKSLLIVESPAKARTLVKYLGPDFEVRASVGHVVDLPPTRLGVDLEHDFEPEYEVIKGKEKVVKDLKKAAGYAQDIYLATDPDREGEAIAWHIAQQLADKKKHPLESFHRVLFHELTKPAIIKAVAEPQRLDPRRYDSQQARRVLDRLVGYQISPLLWDKVKRGLSAGRVQSVALRLVVERERAITSFVPQEYWTVTAELLADQPPAFPARLTKLDGQKFDPHSEAEAQAGVAAIAGQPTLVEKVTNRERRQYAPPPFITSTLQQEAYRKLGFAPKRTMGLAQRLYEGLETNEGAVGLITYMRTDSHRLADVAVAQVRELIAQRFGQDFLPPKPNVFKARAGAQEAHEAIRPTSALRTPESLTAHLKRDELALYRLIYNRFLACQMAPALYDQTQAEIKAGRGLLRASGQVLKFRGFTAVYVEDQDEGAKPATGAEGDNGDEAVAEGMLPALTQGQELKQGAITPRQHFTQPPPRFTEASLVKELEEKGIGRPSTYAAILSTIQDKEYVAKLNKRHLQPTPLGEVISDLLVENFPQVMEVGFTAGLEQSLDQVEEGQREWRGLLKDFYGPFATALKAAQKNMRQIKGKGIPTDLKCPTCAGPMSIRLGKHGEFLACDNYPDCKTTRDFTRDQEGNLVIEEPPPGPEVACDKCGQPMVAKKGRYGPFLACSAYPQCKNVMELDAEGNPKAKEAPEALDEPCPQCGGKLLVKPTRTGGKFISCANYPKCRYSRSLPLGVKCPQCGGELSEKRSRRGKVFFGCDQYPKCDYASWDRPLPEPCPTCGHPFLVQKTTRQGTSIRCPQSGCKYTREG